MRHALNHERSLRHDSGTQRQQDDQSGNTLKPCAAKLRGSDKRSPVPPNFACQKRERERERERERVLCVPCVMAVSDSSGNKQYKQYKPNKPYEPYERTNERTNEQTNKQTNKQTPAVTSPWDSTSPMLLTCSQQEPPVGFEPTTSRLLSGCSAN